MKKTLRIIIPIILVLTIIVCSVWYLFVYDQQFTRDMLLTFARECESSGNHSLAAWFYKSAYSQSPDNDDVAIELAEQYKNMGNYTKAEFTLSNAIADGGGAKLYIALCKTYVEQDKLLDATTMLANITNADIKAELDSMRPEAPKATPTPGFYSQYISVTLECEGNTIYYSADGEYPSTASDPYSEPIALTHGENSVYAIAVSDNGLVSPVSILGYTIGGIVEEVTFTDSVLESDIRGMLNAQEKAIYTSDLWTIKEYTVPANAKDLSVLKHMSFLEKLTISDCKAQDFSFISSLTNLSELTITNTSISHDEVAFIGALPHLKRLTLANCGLSSVSPLSKAVGLVYLDINNNTVRNIEALKNLTGLEELNLQHNTISDVSALEELTKLTKLDISYNAVTTLSPLSNLTGLTWLDAGVNKITSLGKINNLTKLTYLALNSNQLTSISGVNACTAITELNISSNSLSDISSLSKLVNMEHFNFAHNKVENIPEFPKTCMLVTIDGSYNVITKLDPLSGLKNLNDVNMDYNAGISSVKPLESCPVLIQVNVYGTKVKNVKGLTDQSIIVNYKPV